MCTGVGYSAGGTCDFLSCNKYGILFKAAGTLVVRDPDAISLAGFPQGVIFSLATLVTGHHPTSNIFSVIQILFINVLDVIVFERIYCKLYCLVSTSANKY